MLSAYQAPRGFDDAVEHHPAQPVREQGRVHLAQVGAVGVAEVADLPLAQGGPDGIHVPHRVGRGHERQQPPVPALAVGGVGLGPAGEHLLGVGVRRDVVGPQPGEEAGVAVQGGDAGADAARVEADDVVLGGHAGVQALRHVRGQRPAAGARAAGVDEQVTLLVGGWRGGRYLRQRKGDLPPGGIAVVQGHPQAGAPHLGSLHQAGMPVQRAGGPARGCRARRGRARGRRSCHVW